MNRRPFTNNRRPCGCQIIPNDLLLRLSQDAQLSAPSQLSMTNTAGIDVELRTLRRQAGRLTHAMQAFAPAGMAPSLAASAAINVFDCNHMQTLPGTPVSNPGNSPDLSAKRAFDETKAVSDFFAQVFNRNSIDDAGMTLVSSVHFGMNYSNAMWNGLQMIYGDGDGAIFLDFTKSNDVIAHELTHGVTQHTMRLAYVNEAGGLNESMSDVFGSMFRQWRAGHTVQTADWLIGK
jgi:Zn-dependent metalloprotease